MVRRPADRALEGAHQAARLFRRRQHRDAAGARHARPGRHRGRRSPRSPPATCSRASATRARKASCFNASISQQNIFGSRQRAVARRSTRARSTARISLTFTEPYWTVDGVSRTIELYQKNTRSDGSLADRAVRVVDARRGARLRHADHRDRHDQLRLAASSTPNLTLFADSPPVYIDFVSAVRLRRRTAYIADRRLVARHARRHPLSYQGPAAERAASRSACRSATSRTTSSST